MTGVDNNPFAVFSPEGLPAEDVIDLFVKDVPGVDSIQSLGLDEKPGTQVKSSDNIVVVFEIWKEMLTSSFDEAIAYTQRLIDEAAIPSYESPLLRFSTFLAPFFDAWRSLPDMPSSGKY